MRKEKFCPLTEASEVLSKKWALVIVYHLLDGEKRFSELEKSISGISSKVLASTLDFLLKEGIVERIVDTGMPISVKYRLTEKGEDLKGVVDEVSRWSMKWLRKETCEPAVSKGGVRQ